MLGGLFACEQSLASNEVEKLTPQEIAGLMLSDPSVVQVFELQQEIANQRSLAILDGAILPDGPGTVILSTSTSPSELADYLRDHDFLEKSAEKLGGLYSERNKVLPTVQTKYTPYHDMLTNAELVELRQLLPDIRSKVSSSAAIEKLESRNK